MPWYVPQQFFDLYPLEEIKPVEFLRTDLDDIVRNDGKRIFNPDARFELADKANLHKQAQRAYLANISYVDFCLGLVFDTLEKSKYAENELSSMTRQCTGGRRIGELEILKREIAAWSADANHTQRGVDWQMKIDDARYKLTSVYPKILT